MKLTLGFVASFFALAVSGAILSFFLIAPIATDGRISWEEATLAIVPAAAAVVVFLALVLRLGRKAKAIPAGRSETGEGGAAAWKRNVRAVAVLLCGWVMLVVGAGLLFLIQMNTRLPLLDPDIDLIFSAVGPLMIIIGFFVILRGRRLSLVDADYILSSDDRAPLIYLRAFDDDVRDRRVINMLALISPAVAVHTWEAHVAGLMGNFGPFVAIGRPGERLPELGAARMYVDDDEWKSRVFDILSRCKAAVLRGGQTEGLRWELGEIIQILNPRQVLLMLPRKSAQFEKFREWANKVLPRPIPEKLDAQFLMFDDDWTPIPLKHRRSLKTFFRSFLSLFRAGVGLFDTLAPFLKQLDQTEWQAFAANETRRFRRRRNIVAATVATLLLLLGGAGIWLRAESDSARRELERMHQYQEEQQRQLELLEQGQSQ